MVPLLNHKSKITFSPLPDNPYGASVDYTDNHESDDQTTISDVIKAAIIVTGTIWIALTLYLQVETEMEINSPVGLQLKPGTFSLSDFNISNSKLTATWDVTFTFHSSGKYEEDIVVDSIETAIHYKDDVKLAESSSEGFALRYKELKTSRSKLTSVGLSAKNRDGISLAEEMKKDLAKSFGVLNFSLRTDVSVSYKVFRWFRVGYVLPVSQSSCWDLVVRFESDFGDGWLIEGRRKECVL